MSVDRRRRHRRAVALGRFDRALDQRRRGERPGAVVDQHDVRAELALRLEAVAHAVCRVAPPKAGAVNKPAAEALRAIAAS